MAKYLSQVGPVDRPPEIDGNVRPPIHKGIFWFLVCRVLLTADHDDEMRSTNEVGIPTKEIDWIGIRLFISKQTLYRD
jgi:hypothetical protein